MNRKRPGTPRAVLSTETKPYSVEFYSTHAGDSQRGAAAIIPLVMKLTSDTSSVLDVGCGIGTWLAHWSAAGVGQVVGVDGDYVERSQLLVDPAAFVAHDLGTPLHLNRRFDVVASLEVAEHIAPDCADVFVDNLTRHGDLVLFSAAVPGQGGDEHVNEQWQSWWAEKFERRGFACFDVIRPAVWALDDVPWYYRQNTFLYARGEASASLPPGSSPHMLDVIHPFQWGRRTTSLSQHLLRALPPPAQKVAGSLASQVRPAARSRTTTRT